MRHPAARVQVQLVREGQAVRFARVLGQRDPGQLVATSGQRDSGAELRMLLAEIAGIAQLGIGQAVFQ